jgi:lysozyme
MSLTLEGLSFIKNWEGFRERLYICAAGFPTIGFGHVIVASERTKYHKDYVMSKEEALELLSRDLKRFESTVDNYVKAKLTLHQRDALVSFCYNVGTGAFTNSTLLKKLNAGDFNGAALEFLRWCRGGNPSHVIEGLKRRREAEHIIFAKDIPKSKLKLFALPPADRSVIPIGEGEYVRFARCG